MKKYFSVTAFLLGCVLVFGLHAGAQKDQKKPILTAATTPTSIILTWTQSPNPTCTPTPCPVTANKIYRSTVSGGEGGTPLATTATPVATYTDTAALVQGQTYFYQVTAVNVNGESGKSPEASIVFGTPVQTVPNAPTGLSGVAQ